MDAQEYREMLKKWDQETLEQRIQRRNDIRSVTYRGTIDRGIPALLWEYDVEAVAMYIQGHPIGTILLCATVIEIVLADRIVAKTGMTEPEIERFTLEQKTILGRRLGFLEENDVTQINELRKLRNALIHANVGKLTKQAKKHLTVELASPALYFLARLPDADALKCLQTARELAVRFYGEKEQ